MPRLVQITVICARLLVRCPRRNHHALALVQQRPDQPRISVVGLVGNHRLRRAVLEQYIRTLEVMGLPWRQCNACRVTQRIHGGVDLGAQPASASCEGLLVKPPFAPALC